MKTEHDAMEWRRAGYTVTCDRSRIQADVVAGFLAGSYWAKGIPEDVVRRSIEGSLCFALLEGERQIGFARVITDYATFGYLADVFILPEYRGHGLGVWLIECVMSHPGLQGFRRWMLGTRDAHSLYARFGFTPMRNPDRFMERHNPTVYRDGMGAAERDEQASGTG